MVSDPITSKDRVSDEYLANTLREISRARALDSQMISTAFLQMLLTEIIERRASNEPLSVPAGELPPDAVIVRMPDGSLACDALNDQSPPSAGRVAAAARAWIERRLKELSKQGITGGHYVADLMLLEEAINTELLAVERASQPPNASRIIEFRDDDGDEVTVCPTCGQSHIGSSREELRKTLGLSLTKAPVRDEWVDIGEDGKPVRASWDANGSPVEKEALPLCDCDTDTGCKEYRQDKFRCANEEAERASPETRARPACTCELDADMCLIHG